MQERRSPRERDAVRRVALLALCATAAFLAVASAASAQSLFSLRAVTPRGYFVERATPGSSVHERVIVVNRGTTAGIVHLFAVDAETGRTSGAVYPTQRTRHRDVGAWTTVTPGRVRLAPGQQRVIDVVARVPLGVRPGDHLGGIVAQGKPVAGSFRKHGTGRFRINVQTLSIVALELKTPGRRTVGLALRRALQGGIPGEQEVLIRMANTGDMLYKGVGTIRVVDDAGRTKFSNGRLAIDTFVPRTQIDYPVHVTGNALAPGHYRAVVAVRYRKRLVSAVLPFTVTQKNLTHVFGGQPGAHAVANGGTSTLTLILGGLALVALSFGAAALWFRRRLARVAGTPGPGAAPAPAPAVAAPRADDDTPSDRLAA